MAADLTIDVADESGENPEDQHVMRQLEAGKRVLTGFSGRKTISKTPISS